MTSLVRNHWSRRCAGSLLIVSLFIFTGCTDKPKATVKGKVTYKNQPVTSGSVNFISATGAAAMAPLDANGAFTFSTPIEAGTYKVYLLPPVPEQLPPGQVSKRPPFNIPPKFQDPTQSGISKEVKKGDNDIPIDITD